MIAPARRRARVAVACLGKATPLLIGLLVTLQAAAQGAATQRFPIAETTISAIHAAFEAGTLSCRELASRYLARIDAYDVNGPALNSIQTVNPRVLEDAAALDAEHARSGLTGPLHCVPVVLKDNINTTDMPTTNGSAILANSAAREDATIVARLEAAGALILGKTAMGELAAGSYSTAGGQQRNPYHPERNPGGSSSGSGAAVAANLTAIAVGTDTYTSVRGPAADNGIVGFRPTTGLVSRAGIGPRKTNIDTAGPMARTVTDAAILLNVLAGPDPADPLSLDVHARYAAEAKTADGYADFTRSLSTTALDGARLGVVRDFFGGDPEIDALAEAALATLEAEGAELVEVRLDLALAGPYVRDWIGTLDNILVYAFWQAWDAYLETLALAPGVPGTVAEWVEAYETELADGRYPPAVGGFSALSMMRASLERSASDPAYVDLIERVLPEVTRLKLAIFETHGVDALVFPYRSTFAPPISNPLETVEDSSFVAAPGVPSPAVLGGYSSVGFPMLVVPMGLGSQGLPTGIGFMGRPYEDRRVLGYGFDYEQASRLRRASPLVPAL